MNLSRNKLNKIANTKYQSRKNRPLKKKKAGASKIHTKFTKKRKNGGKGKNLRKNSLKKKIKFNKKGGAGNIEELKNAVEVAQESLIKAAAAAEAAAGAAAPDQAAAEEAVTLAEEALDVEQKALDDAEAQKALEDEAAAQKAVADEAAAAQKAVADEQKVAAAAEAEPEQQSTENPQGDFTVTMKLGIDKENNIYVKEVTPSLDNGNPNSGNSTIASLATGKSVNETDFEQLPMKDMLKKIFDMLTKEQ